MADASPVRIHVASRLVVDSATVFAPGALATRGDVVVAAGPPRGVVRGVPGKVERVELPGLVLLPGLVNAHTHLSIPMLTAPDGSPVSSCSSFVEWILRIVAWKRSAPPEEFPRNVAAAAAASLASGTTAVGEIAGPDLGAYAALPLRARVFAEGIGFHAEAAPEVLASVRAAVDRIEALSGENGLLLPGVSPHTLYTVGAPLLKLMAGLAAERALPAALHLAESPVEMEFLSAGTGEVRSRLYPAVGKDVSFFHGIGMPIGEYLDKAGLLREGLLLVHNVHLSPGEIAELCARGARFVLCPRSNAAHGNGEPDLTRFIDRDVPFALGTDSLASVPGLGMWDEMRAAVSLYRGTRPAAEACRAVFRAATKNGARALGLPCGTLRPGAAADFLAVDDPGGPPARVFAALVEKGSASTVRAVFVGGCRRHGAP
jgi:aminodeoxyfutalosine deaminase